jgi:mono/diheme cytochrome c family protein
MALLFQPRARAVRVLIFAVLGAGALASAVHGQPPPAPAARAATAASLAPDPDEGGIKRPEGFRAVMVADALKNGDAAPAASAAPATPAADSPGGKLYSMACATCHMPDGSGVPGMQPALMGSKVVAGPPATVIKVLLLGPEKALPAHKATSGNQMPQFDSLSDEDIASILTYVRKTFGKGASAITPAQVKAQRPK